MNVLTFFLFAVLSYMESIVYTACNNRSRIFQQKVYQNPHKNQCLTFCNVDKKKIIKLYAHFAEQRVPTRK